VPGSEAGGWSKVITKKKRPRLLSYRLSLLYLQLEFYFREQFFLITCVDYIVFTPGAGSIELPATSSTALSRSIAATIPDLPGVWNGVHSN